MYGIRCSPHELDLGLTGVRHVSVELDYEWRGERNVLAYPLTVVHNGPGPCALVLGGTHGDEFEGQLAATRLAQSIQADEVSGTLIIVATHNRPAALAGTRLSPIDGLDLNRIFPGGDGAGPSHAIARFVTERLIGAADAVFDVHSGGTTHEFVLSSNLQARVGSDVYDRHLPALLAIDAPYALVFDEVGNNTMPHGGSVEAAAMAQGKLALSTELAGAARLTPESLATCEDGIRNLLHYLGVLSDGRGASAPSRSQLLSLSRAEQYVDIPKHGQFVPHVWLGDKVEEGQLVGELYWLEEPGTAPFEVLSPLAGTIVMAACKCHVDPAEPVFAIAEAID